MSLKKTGLNRRDFLKQMALASLGTLAYASIPCFTWAASKERLTILSTIGLDSIHPYAYTFAPQYSI